ncbi:MAG: recombinase family protein [Planctomycetaceae bacterium]|nr:recombinase family protein [Planctomycetaceae bacterium]
MRRKLKAAGYIRMSSDHQGDSPARQRAEIERLAANDGYHIVEWYEDHGLTGTESKNRPDFQRLLADASSGKFEAVLVSEQSRMSREDVFDAIAHWRLLRDAGVKLVTVQRGEMRFDDLSGILTAMIEQHGAREESVKLSKRVTSGKREKYRRGERAHGNPLFGFDRVITNEAGQLVQRVHFSQRFQKPAGWRQSLAPSTDVASVEAIRWAFRAVTSGTPLIVIAQEFNRRGLRSIYGKKFVSQSIKSLLKNPAYCGDLQAGTDPKQGKFSRVCEDGPIILKDSHEGIVSRDVFENVQSLLASRSYAQGSVVHLLKGLVQCAESRHSPSTPLTGPKLSLRPAEGRTQRPRHVPPRKTPTRTRAVRHAG